MAANTTRSKEAKQRATGAKADKDMGVALRSVYQKTVEETVPAEMLELLGKLG